MSVPVLTADHVLTYTYRRSVGPILGQFFEGLREGVLWGILRRDGSVLFPPAEHDPDTGEPLTDWVQVGPGGVVLTWAWVTHPRPGHPLGHPFAWALIRLDGASTALVHAVDVSDVSAMKTGMRVHVSWSETRVGSIRDMASFRPEST